MRTGAPASPATALAQAGRAAVGPQLNPGSSEPISITFRNASLKAVLGFIATATGIAVTYDAGFVDVARVNVDVKNATLEAALEQILTPHQLSYRVIDERSILVGKPSR
jgi:type II secretory pathway component GspD/PulD (secretin)